MQLSSDVCSECKYRAAITESAALSNGVRWDMYQAHPLGYRTCWACKNAHKSVMTRSIAMKKFSVLKGVCCTPSSKTNLKPVT